MRQRQKIQKMLRPLAGCHGWNAECDEVNAIVAKVEGNHLFYATVG
jgi:hypothetical protein